MQASKIADAGRLFELAQVRPIVTRRRDEQDGDDDYRRHQLQECESRRRTYVPRKRKGKQTRQALTTPNSGRPGHNNTQTHEP